MDGDGGRPSYIIISGILLLPKMDEAKSIFGDAMQLQKFIEVEETGCRLGTDTRGGRSGPC